MILHSLKFEPNTANVLACDIQDMAYGLQRSLIETSRFLIDVTVTGRFEFQDRLGVEREDGFTLASMMATDVVLAR